MDLHLFKKEDGHIYEKTVGRFDNYNTSKPFGSHLDLGKALTQLFMFKGNHYQYHNELKCLNILALKDHNSNINVTTGIFQKYCLRDDDDFINIQSAALTLSQINAYKQSKTDIASVMQNLACFVMNDGVDNLVNEYSFAINRSFDNLIDIKQDTILVMLVKLFSGNAVEASLLKDFKLLAIAAIMQLTDRIEYRGSYYFFDFPKICDMSMNENKFSINIDQDYISLIMCLWDIILNLIFELVEKEPAMLPLVV